MSATPSLRQNLKNLSVRWALVVFVLCGAISFAFVSVVAKRTEELRIQTIARSVARAYRPLIVGNLVRDAQAQMKNALTLSEGEMVLVRGKKLETLYSPDGEEHPAICAEEERVCWRGSTMTYLQPVYFDGNAREELFGYVELTLRSQGQTSTALTLLGIIGGLCLLFVLGLLASVARVSTIVDRTLLEWSEALRAALRGDAKKLAIPYAEFAEAGELIRSLHREVEKLRSDAAAEAHVKGQLSVLRGVGHDLKTPFSQLRKYFEVLVMKFGRTGTLDPATVRHVRDSSERVTLLLKEIKHATQPEPETDDGTTSVDLAEAAAEYLTILTDEPDFASKDISIDKHLPVGSHFASISGIQFYRIFDNLMKNALDAVPLGGKISVTVGRSRGLPSILVEDDGEGIRSEYLSKIFSADFTTKAARGMGLGLSIVQKICADAGAKVSVQSEPGKGTSFYIQFPEAVIGQDIEGQTLGERIL